MLQGVIFDIDGTLVGSNDAHAQSWVDAFAEAGYEVPFDVVRPLIEIGGDKLLPKTVDVRHDSEKGKKLLARRSGIFHEKYLPRLKPFPGSRALVLRVRAEGAQVYRRDIGKGRRAEGPTSGRRCERSHGRTGDCQRREAFKA